MFQKAALQIDSIRVMGYHGVLCPFLPNYNNVNSYNNQPPATEPYGLAKESVLFSHRITNHVHNVHMHVPYILRDLAIYALSL